MTHFPGGDIEIIEKAYEGTLITFFTTQKCLKNAKKIVAAICFKTPLNEFYTYF